MKTKIPCVLGILAFLIASTPLHAVAATKVVVYAAYGCSLCPNDPVREATVEYFGELTRTLKETGITDVQLRLIDVDLNAQKEMDELYQKLAIPESMRGSLAVIIDEKFLFIHVPVGIIGDFLRSHTTEYEMIAVFRDLIHGGYRVMNKEGKVVECEIKTSVSDCLGAQGASLPSLPSLAVLSLVALSGLLDGVNPCAFAVLLFFVTFLFARGITGGKEPQQLKNAVMLFGSVYILAVYLTYLLIGLTLRQAIALVPFPHVASKVGAFIAIGAGITKVKDRFWPSRGFSLKLSPSRWEAIRRWMHGATLAASFLAGILVALFEFPCTGGIYLAILSMLAARKDLAEGFVYLLVYNAMFILPLLAILIVASRKGITEFSLKKWQKHEGKNVSLIEGLIYTVLGAFLFVSGLA